MSTLQVAAVGDKIKPGYNRGLIFMKLSIKPIVSVGAFLLFVSISITNSAVADTSRRHITVDDQHAFKSVASPVFSPDRKWLAYTVSSNDVAANKSITRIWMLPAVGGTPIPMTSATVSSRQPVFSKDGKTLYFISARGDKKAQVWSLNLEFGGEARQVTDNERGVSRINFSSDEKKLLLVLTDEDKTEPLVEGSKPWVVDRLNFKQDYVGYVGHLRDHIYILDIASGQLTQITHGDFDDSQPAWSPDDKQIAFTSNRNPEADYNTDIWLIESKTGATSRKLTSNTGSDSSPVWHPDGEWLAISSARPGVEPNYAINHLARISVSQPEIEFLMEDLDRNVNRIRFSDDGKSIYFLIEDSGERHLARLNLKQQKITRLVTGQRMVTDFALGARNQLAGIVNQDTQPGELFVSQGSDIQIITEANKSLLNQLQLARTEEIHFEAPDGWPIEGFVTFPVGFEHGQKYPAILRIHGGPVGQYGHGFSFESQLLAARGYVVVRSNPRGSSGYGQDFTMGLYQGWGEKDYQDVLAAVDHVIAQGYVDPERLGVGGYSYGGILTNYLLGQTDRFKAAVSGAGSGHYLASYGHDEYRVWYETELGLPWESRELWERLSPFNYIHRATTPTMFFGGDKDWNVPIQGSEQLYQVMKRVGIETRLVVYPGEHHGGWSFANEKDAWLRRLAWYDRFLMTE